MDSILVKICGINDLAAARAAVDAGADLIGFMFYPPSPRSVTLEQAARLADAVGDRVTKVAVLVDADDATVDAVVGSGAVDMLQLHGAETPERAATLKIRTGLPVMKALRVAEPADVTMAADYDGKVDRILFDAKPPKGMTGALPGGNGLTFDWRLLDGVSLTTPWMLSGGLDAGNVAAAIRLTGAVAVDTSSGVEDRPGVKNPDKIRAFIAAAKGAA
ncbi:MAG: phosphoribosylanthranilate isomerase [Alphaproteobacteria bacterium]|nr:phosphoribosylanthranilate isomerase [Alphaproteobacteria bacterium]